MSLHEGKNPLQCYICDANFEQKNDMIFHIGTLHEGNTWGKMNDKYQKQLKFLIFIHINIL